MGPRGARNQQGHGSGGRPRAGVRFPRRIHPSPLEGGNQGQGIQAVLLLLRFLGHFRGVSHAFPFTGRRAGFPLLIPQVNRFHGVILSALLRRSLAHGVPPREGEWREEDWPQAVSAVQAANPASNTRERIRTFIFISLQECDRCTVRNQRLFTLALIPELLRLFPCRICQTKCGMPPQAPGCTHGNWRPGTPCPHAALSRRECASTAASWRR